MKAVTVTEGQIDFAGRNSCKQLESGEADLPAMWSRPEHNFV